MTTRNTINQLFKAAEKQGINFKIYSMEEEGFVIYNGASAKKAYDATREEGGAQCYLSKDGLQEWVFALHWNDPDESVSDCTYGKWIDKWCTDSDFGQTDSDLKWEACHEAYTDEA